MKIVIAPDSFKESLTAKQVSQAIKTGLKRVWPEAEFVCIPVADGGEGTVQALVDATGGKLVLTEVNAPLGNQVEAVYGVLGDGKTAVIEMAQASGLNLVPNQRRDPKLTSSYGTGQLVKHALDAGIRRFMIGLGGSATNDAGSGMLAALGVKFYNQNGDEFAPSGLALTELSRIDISDLDARLALCEIFVACDVDNPLCGDRGASAVFGPQKGASAEDVITLDQALYNFGLFTEQVTGHHVLSVKGSGAAGGMGAAWMAYTPAIVKSGIDMVLDTVGLAEKLVDTDIVFTGEGCIDQQTIYGKAPVGVAKLAKAFNIPVIAVAGCTGENYQAVYQHGIDAVFPCTPRAMSLPEALAEAEVNLINTAESVGRLWQLSRCY
ncbi:glycerate kinase [Vibrio sp. V27_P1S3P104]|uniref:glycerate kinase n=1 Tax=unclassified Vibrio TaxID=2614977 RepID=UPI0013726E6E|nr:MULTISPECIES: glycerate kinase [unclassified Vibrio]NAW68923.1 glycerate kinase [Vibrio sp. V28_P6S34P95]NAX05136.1 glycerate kinase [Vibrio sp. V30_P3S12P165]NAX33364.1 glycerate kinase [Vibrio sp. V29_P1S30P107]NAX37616.1 glycerate kinase [Vibrio sp. V27_P1S3P104]NAX39518.1 glycerate kinase [Vibrio sp. V26_P1S5P106]